MQKIKNIFICCILFVGVPLSVLAMDDDSVTPCIEDGSCISEPYEPSECELQMWDIYAAADQAVQELFKRPICEEYVASWQNGADVGVGIEAHEQVANFVDSVAMNNGKNLRKVFISKKKLRKLKKAAKSCR